MKLQTPDRWIQNSWVPATPPDREDRRSGDLQRLGIDRGLVGAATEIGDQDPALASGEAYIESEFQILYGDQVAELERERGHVQSRVDVEKTALDGLDAQLAGEPPQIHASQKNGGAEGPADPKTEVPPRDWQLLDKLEAGVALVAIILLSIASYFGVHATFTNAQLPIVDDNAHLPFILATLVPVAGLAVKLAGNVFSDPANRDLYRKGVAITGLVAFFFWVPMFAALFEGLSGVFDPFKDPNHFLGWAFNVGHIFAEVLIAAGIWSHLSSVMRKYAPTELVDNPARPPLERAKAAQIEVVEALSARLGGIEGKLSQFYGLRDSARILVDTAIRQKMNQKPHDGLL